MDENFSDLLFLRLQLLLVRNREPSTAAIHLEIVRQFDFERRFFDDSDELRFYTIGAVFEYSDIDRTFRDSTARDQDLLTRGIAPKTDTSEDQLFDIDIIECGSFHEKKSEK